VSLWRWPSFNPEEVLSPEGLSCLSRNVLLVHPFALDRLQGFRNYLGTPLLVNHGTLKLRGYRSMYENEMIKGARFSQHCMGLAFDVTVRGIPSAELADLAESYGWHGIGTYGTFVHLDLRPRLDDKAVVRWGAK